MKIELTEEEREFLERICIRAKLFAMNDWAKNLKSDLQKIEALIEKLKKEKNE